MTCVAAIISAPAAGSEVLSSATTKVAGSKARTSSAWSMVHLRRSTSGTAGVGGFVLHAFLFNGHMKIGAGHLRRRQAPDLLPVVRGRRRAIDIRPDRAGLSST
jgi:hypothetical protein